MLKLSPSSLFRVMMRPWSKSYTRMVHFWTFKMSMDGLSISFSWRHSPRPCHLPMIITTRLPLNGLIATLLMDSALWTTVGCLLYSRTTSLCRPIPLTRIFYSRSKSSKLKICKSFPRCRWWMMANNRFHAVWLLTSVTKTAGKW